MSRFLAFSMVSAILLAAGCVPTQDQSGYTDEQSDQQVEEQGAADDTNVADTTEPDTNLQDMVSVSPQKPGKEVTVDKMVFSKSGFLTLHKDSDGAPGDPVANSQLISAGESAWFNWVLSFEMQAGEVYWAMLHTDDGNGVYEFPGPDGPIKDVAGNIVMSKFEVKE